jgi:hypothetical protein
MYRKEKTWWKVVDMRAHRRRGREEGGYIIREDSWREAIGAKQRGPVSTLLCC